MKKHIYYRLILQLKSPLALSSGMTENTDNDVITDGLGRPYIPATSLAGVLRSKCDSQTQRKLFGYIDNQKQANSALRFYDFLLLENAYITNRDGVALENKIAKNNMKFDFEAVETGAQFMGYIELDKNCPEEAAKIIEELLAEVNSGELGFGAKTTRGYGRVTIAELLKKEFAFPADQEAWLDFDMFAELAWNSQEDLWELSDKPHSLLSIALTLRNQGAISIRQYNADAIEGSPDYSHLTLKNGNPVIPGTSWAGAIRQRFAELSGKEELVKEYFGYVNPNQKDKALKSKVIISESIITDTIPKVVTRNAIDRFSAGTKNGALYTEQTFYNGRTTLNMLIPKDSDSEFQAVLGAVLLDLAKGYLAVGGLTAVGRGIFEAEKLLVGDWDRTELLGQAQLDSTEILKLEEIR